MNIVSLATIKNQKNVSKNKYNKCLEAAAYKNLFDLKEIKNFHIDNNENGKLFYKVNKPFKFNKTKDIFSKDPYDDIFSYNNEVIMEKGHIYEFIAYNMNFNNKNKIDASQFSREEIKQAINEHKDKILLEIIDLYDYIKDEMILYSEELSSEFGVKKSYIVLDSEEKLYELIKKNKIIMVQACDEVLQKALLTTKKDIERKALIEQENWISLKGSGYKSFRLYTDACASYDKFKYESNYTGGLKELIINNKDKIRKAVPELTNREGNLIYERVGCFKNLYEDLNKNKDYYNLLKEAVELKVKKHEDVNNFNSQKIDEEVNNKVKTKALYIAKENIDEYVLSSIQKRIIKEYISNSDHRTSIMLEKGSKKVLDVLKNEYAKKIDTAQLKSSIIKDGDLDNIYEYFYSFNDNSYKEELETILIDDFGLNKNNAELFINDVLDDDYYSCKDDDVISKSIKIIDNEGYFFVTFNGFIDKLEDDLLRYSEYKEVDFEKIKSNIEKYSLVFKLSDIEELNTSEDIARIFGETNRLINLKEKLISQDEDLTDMVPACEDLLKDSNLIKDVLNSEIFNIECVEKIFESYKKHTGISNDTKFNDFFNIMIGKSFVTTDFLNKERITLENGEYQGLSIKVKYMSDEEYEDKCAQIENLESSKYKEFFNFLISKYYNTNLNDEEKKDCIIKLKNIFQKVTQTVRFHKETGIIDPFLNKIIKSSKDIKDSNCIDAILGYSKKYKLHSINLEDDDNLELAHDIFQIITGAKLKNGALLGGSEIALNIKECNSEIISFYINAICSNLQSEEEANYINDLLKRYIIFENESIQRVNGRYKVVESLREYYSKADVIEYLCRFIDEIMTSSVNSKMKYAINEIKINNSGIIDICIVKNEEKYKESGRAKLNYKSLKSIDIAMYNVLKELNRYDEKDSNFMSSITGRYLEEILSDKKFINSMEQSSNITIALAAQYDSSKYSNYKEDKLGKDKLINEKNIDNAKIKNISIQKATADKGYILQEEISNVFNDTIRYKGNEEKVNAYKINVEHMHLSNPLYKELFTKDINHKYIYENLFNGCTPEEYSKKKNIKPIISEIFIPAFKSNGTDNEDNLKLKDLRRKSADLINSLYILEKYNEYYNSSINEYHKENKSYEIKSLVDFKNNAEKILKNYYKSLIYEADNDYGYFKNSIEAEIDNSAGLKIENITGYINESHEKYRVNLFKKSKNSPCFFGANYVNPKDIFKENYKEAYINIGKQLLTDNIDMSEEFYTYIKSNFIRNLENINDIKKNGKTLLKEESTLEKIGKNYLKEIGIASMIFYDVDNISPRIKFTRTYVTSAVPEGVTYVDSGSREEVISDQGKVFFEGIKKDKNNKYFLRKNHLIEDIYKSVESLNSYDDSRLKNDYKDNITNKIKSCDLESLKEIYLIRKSSDEDSNIKNHIFKNISDKNFDYNYCVQEGKSLYISKNKGTRENSKINIQPLFKKMEYVYKRLNEDNYNKQGILEEVYSRKYGEDIISLDNNEVKKGSKVYSINKDDAGLFEVIDIYRNNNGNAELKIRDVRSNKLKIIQDKSFEGISKKIHDYKIAMQDKSNESILNYIKEKTKDEYISDFSESFQAVNNIFNKPVTNRHDIQSEALKEIRKEYDKDTVSDYVDIIQVLKKKNMISEDEVQYVSKKMHKYLKKSMKSQSDYKQNLYSLLKNNKKFKERNIDTSAKVENFLSNVVTKENLEEIKNNEEIKKAKSYTRINISEADEILNEYIKDIINKSSYKDESTYKLGKEIVHSLMENIKKYDKYEEHMLNEIYKKNSYNERFLSEVLNLNDDSVKDVENIKKITIGYGSYAGLSIGELNNEELNKILKNDYSRKLNYEVNKNLVRKTKDAIIKAKSMDKDGIINNEDKIITKEKLTKYLGNSYIDIINEKINDKKKQKRKEKNMYNNTSKLLKSSFSDLEKKALKNPNINVIFNKQSILSYDHPIQGIDIEPNISPIGIHTNRVFNESLNIDDINHKDIPISDKKYYEQQKINSSINISAELKSNSIKADLSQLISKAVGGDSLNINMNFNDSRSTITQDEINSMIENSIK